jgi:hypothetical protein
LFIELFVEAVHRERRLRYNRALAEERCDGFTGFVNPPGSA